MPKRAHHEVDDDAQYSHAAKRLRPRKQDRLSILSDELLLRTLSFLPLAELVLCERLSRRLKSLAADGQLWKAMYYDRFVRPRASRIPGIRMQREVGGALHYSSKLSKWLDDEKLVRDGSMTNWKRQYKLRHNWSKGSAHIRETEVAERPSTPPLLIRLHEDVIVIADEEHGLRAWSLKKEHELLATYDFRMNTQWGSVTPTSLAIDTNGGDGSRILVVVGFNNGRFSIYHLERHQRYFQHRWTHPASAAGEVAAIACSSPFLLTISPEPRLSLYSLGSDHGSSKPIDPPKLISSMRSHTAYAPISLALRSSASNIVACIAFAMPSYMPKWTIGIQELRLAGDGTVLDSRVAFAARPQRRAPTDAAHMDLLSILPLPSSRPASLSYNHPYLLTAHPDNTLTLYMVTSTAEELDISSGTILWGHTSSISSVHVGDRGKAVSVSTRGNELRVWELEGRGLPSASRRRVPVLEQASVRVAPSEVHPEACMTAGWEISSVAAPVVNETAKGWIAFDEEKVVLLREKMHGAQAVVVYDFT